MTVKELIEYWKQDFLRYRKYGVSCFSILFLTPGFVYCFHMRLCKYLKKSRFHILYLPLYIIFRLILQHYGYKFGIQIPYTTQIGQGFYIGHFGNIFVNSKTIIGNNVNISQGVTLGIENGAPTIGDGVYIGPGAKVVGNIIVGNNASIGANSVLINKMNKPKSIPDNAVVMGIPAKVISLMGNRKAPLSGEAILEDI